MLQKLSLFLNDNTAKCMFLKKKETITKLSTMAV